MPNELKTSICDALAAFIRQRPQLDSRNYDSLAAYRREQSDIARDKRDAETLVQAIRWHDGITAQHIIDAARRAYSGRLSITVDDSGHVRLDYSTCQYRPTEYRKAVADVCATALWDYQLAHMPEPNGSTQKDYGSGVHEVLLYDGLSAGDWLRRYFRRAFGSRLQRRWFN